MLQEQERGLATSEWPEWGRTNTFQRRGADGAEIWTVSRCLTASKRSGGRCREREQHGEGTEGRRCRAGAQEAAGQDAAGVERGQSGGPWGSLKGGENAKEFRGRAVGLIQPHWPWNPWRMLTGGADRGL